MKLVFALTALAASAAMALPLAPRADDPLGQVGGDLGEILDDGGYLVDDLVDGLTSSILVGDEVSRHKKACIALVVHGES